MNKIIIYIIKIYKYTIDPFIHSSCKFNPTCTNYMIKVLSTKKINHALILIIKRLLKCNPFFYGEKI